MVERTAWDVMKTIVNDGLFKNTDIRTTEATIVELAPSMMYIKQDIHTRR